MYKYRQLFPKYWNSVGFPLLNWNTTCSVLSFLSFQSVMTFYLFQMLIGSFRFECVTCIMTNAQSTSTLYIDDKWIWTTFTRLILYQRYLEKYEFNLILTEQTRTRIKIPVTNCKQLYIWTHCYIISDYLICQTKINCQYRIPMVPSTSIKPTR